MCVFSAIPGIRCDVFAMLCVCPGGLREDRAGSGRDAFLRQCVSTTAIHILLLSFGISSVVAFQ